jgi:hypothetical protein
LGVAGSFVARDRTHELGRRDISAGRNGHVTSREPDRLRYRVSIVLIRHRRSCPLLSQIALRMYPIGADMR